MVRGGVGGGVRGGVRHAIVHVEQDCDAAGIPVELQADTRDSAFANSPGAILITGLTWMLLEKHEGGLLLA